MTQNGLYLTHFKHVFEKCNKCYTSLIYNRYILLLKALINQNSLPVVRIPEPAMPDRDVIPSAAAGPLMQAMQTSVGVNILQLSFVSAFSTQHALSIIKPKSSPKSKSQIQVKSRSKIQVQNPKTKVLRKGTGTGADTIILQATHPPTINFSHLKCQSSDGKRPSMTFYYLSSPSKTFMTYDLI